MSFQGEFKLKRHRQGCGRLASSLDIETTAEGVETPDQLEIVRCEGCTSAQGFFFYPPMSAGQVNSLLGFLQSPPTRGCPLCRMPEHFPSVGWLPTRRDGFMRFTIRHFGHAA